jgi:phosphate uptake regulator
MIEQTNEAAERSASVDIVDRLRTKARLMLQGVATGNVTGAAFDGLARACDAAADAIAERDAKIAKLTNDFVHMELDRDYEKLKRAEADAEIKRLRAEVGRLLGYVEAFRREETRADKLAEIADNAVAERDLLRQVVERVADADECGWLQNLAIDALNTAKCNCESFAKTRARPGVSDEGEGA